jgi:hypothetical protein
MPRAKRAKRIQITVARQDGNAVERVGILRPGTLKDALLM